MRAKIQKWPYLGCWEVWYELVLILLNLDFEIDRSWMNFERFLKDIHIPTRAKYYPHSNSCLCWALLRDVSIWVLNFFLKWFATKFFLLASPKNIGVHASTLKFVSTANIFTTPRSWMNCGRFLKDIHIPTRAKYYPHNNSCLCWALLRDVFIWVLIFFWKWFAINFFFASLTQKYWRACLHSKIYVHRQYIHNSPISIIMV
jgi:hypothetical protein